MAPTGPERSNRPPARPRCAGGASCRACGHVAAQLRPPLRRPHTGETPARAVAGLRLEAARRLLTERPDLPVALVAQRCGFGDDERMRRAFLRALGVPPAEYRLRFGGTVADAGQGPRQRNVAV